MRVMHLYDNEIVLENFDEIKQEEILTFKLLPAGITITAGNEAKLPNHYLVSNQNGIIKEPILIEELKNIKHPQESSFTKINNVFIQDSK